MKNIANIDEIGFTSRTIILRDKEGLTQAQFAERIDVSAVLVSDIERKKKKLSLQSAVRISEEFHVSLDWLYELSDDTKDSASDIINNLHEAFEIDFKNRTISVDEDLADFLDKIFSAYETKKEKEIPDEALKYWVDGIKKEYNEKIAGKRSERIYKKYYLQDYHEHKLEHACSIH